MIKGVKGSGVKIADRSFKFDGDKIKYKLSYMGNGKAPDKRFDKNCEGLCIFICTTIQSVASLLLFFNYSINLKKHYRNISDNYFNKKK